MTQNFALQYIKITEFCATMSIGSSIISRRSYKIILLGDSGVGKTSIIQRFINNHFDPHENPTIGIDFLGKTVHHKGHTCRLQLWDSAGQQKYMSLIPSYLRDADCVIFVFDCSKPATLQGMQKWINLSKQNNQKKAISLICGNKADLNKNIDRIKLQELMDKYKMAYHAVSAKTGDNITQLFHLIVDMMVISNKSRESSLKKIEEILKDEIESAPTTEGGMVSTACGSQKGKSVIKVKEKDKQEKRASRQSCFC